MTLARNKNAGDCRQQRDNAETNSVPIFTGPIRPLLTFLMACGFFLAPCVALGQQRKTFIEEFADAIGMAVRAAIGEEDREQAVMDVAVAAPMAVQPLQDEVKRRKARISAYSEAMQTWIADVCELTDEQKARVKEVADRETKKSHDAWLKRDANAANQQLGDTFPIKFTIRYGTAQSLDLTRHYKKIQDILSEEQLAKLKKASSERRSFQIEAMVNRVLNMLDEELYLSKQQREEMFEPLKRRLNGMESSSFSFHGQSYYYQQQSIGFLLQRGDHLKGLNEPQRHRAKDLASMSNNNSYNTEQYILFQSNEGTDGWYKKLATSAKEQRQRVYRACAVRSAFYMSEWSLPEPASRHLTVAGKGIADRVIAEWKKTIERQLKTYEEQAGRFGGNFSFSMQVVDLNQIETNDLWKHTIDRLKPEDAADIYDRATLLRNRQAQFLTAALDREMWFRPEQRDEVRQRIEKGLPTKAWQNPYRNYMDEVALLVIPLFKFSNRDASIFEGVQKKAWDTLKKEFEYNGRYVMVHMKNGGQFHFMLPP